MRLKGPGQPPEQLVSAIHYCYQCLEWIVGAQWEDHYQSHWASWYRTDMARSPTATRFYARATARFSSAIRRCSLLRDGHPGPEIINYGSTSMNMCAVAAGL